MPDDVILLIIRRLDVTAIGRLACACKKLRNLTMRDDVWTRFRAVDEEVLAPLRSVALTARPRQTFAPTLAEQAARRRPKLLPARPLPSPGHTERTRCLLELALGKSDDRPREVKQSALLDRRAFLTNAQLRALLVAATPRPYGVASVAQAPAPADRRPLWTVRCVCCVVRR